MAPDLLVIGGGPAGLAAGLAAQRCGASVLLVDENDMLGGQIHRAADASPWPDRHARILGEDYRVGRALIGSFKRAGVPTRLGALAWSIGTDGVAISQGGRSSILRPRHVLLATGAMERPMPFPGWTLPGVMTIGAAQIAMKRHGLLPAGRTVLAGHGPLLWLYAAQMLRAGAPPTAILDTTPRARIRAALKHLPGFARSPYGWKGARLLAEVAARVPVIRHASTLQAEGSRQLEGVTADAGGRKHRFAVDQMLIHQGVVPNLNLSLLAGLRLREDREQACLAPVHDSWFRSSDPSITIVGDGGGIAGADAALASGEIGAIGACRDLGLISADRAETLAAGARRRLARALRGRRFLDVAFGVGDAFRLPPDPVIVCRCEDVTAGAIRSALADGASGPNHIKAYLRCGMGPCQGRNCALTVASIVAAERGESLAQVGLFKVRAPLKPLPLAEIAALADGIDAGMPGAP
jgi:NADPH-dependent 2,4-dienoyl-CoA reductase/sulfur reductase-like enzyme